LWDAHDTQQRLDRRFEMKKHKFRQETEAVHGGANLAKKNGPLATPIYQTSTFEVTDMQEQVRATPTDSYYTRYGNPTNTAAENAIAELEGTDAALLFSSGMAAITTSILALVKAGDHIVAQRDIYGGVIRFLSQWLPSLGIETTFVDTNDVDQHECAIRPNTKLLHIESPTNPTVRVVDLEKIAAFATANGLEVMLCLQEHGAFSTTAIEHAAASGVPTEELRTVGWESGNFQEALQSAQLSREVAERVFPTVTVASDRVRSYFTEHPELFQASWKSSAQMAFFAPWQGPPRRASLETVDLRSRQS